MGTEVRACGIPAGLLLGGVAEVVIRVGILLASKGLGGGQFPDTREELGAVVVCVVPRRAICNTSLWG